MRISTAAIIRTGDRILFVKRPPGGDLGEFWELPGGKVDEGESPREALQRELMEELELDCAVHERLATSEFTHRGVEFELQAYRVNPGTGPITLHEHSDLLWCTIGEARELTLAPSDRELLTLLFPVK